MAASLEELPLPDELPVIPDSWSYMSLGDLVEERGVCYGIVQPGSEVTDGVPIVRVNNIRNGRIDTSDMMKVDPEIEAKFQRSRLRGGEVLLTLVGTLGETAIVPDNFRGWNVARAVGVIPVRKDPGSLWISICLRSSFVQHCIRMWATTTVQATFNLRDLAKLPIPMPPKDTRKAIAHILGTLDDKIELNRRMNATLEEMARALFQSWFVDFDPVRAKLDGRQPAGLDAATAALFPAHFQESPLGHIPQGWEVISLPEAIDFLEGPGLRNWQYRDEGMKFLNIRCIGDGDLDIVKANCISPEEFEKTYRHFALQEDDIVISTSGTLGRLAIVRADHLPVMLNTSIIRMRGRGAVGLAYVWGFLQSEYFLSEMFALAAGSVQLNFGPMHLRKISILRPPDGILEAFERATEPLLRKCLHVRKESRTLATLRDALLPKLLSGELSVADAKKIAGGSA